MADALQRGSIGLLAGVDRRGHGDDVEVGGGAVAGLRGEFEPFASV